MKLLICTICDVQSVFLMCGRVNFISIFNGDEWGQWNDEFQN